MANTGPMDDGALAALFAQAGGGNLRDARVFRDAEGQSRGIALVRFHDHASAARALRQLAAHASLRVRWGFDREADGARRGPGDERPPGHHAAPPAARRPAPAQGAPSPATAGTKKNPKPPPSANLFFGTAVPGLPPSAGVDKKYAHLYAS